MSWIDSIRTAWGALTANKLRSALTMLGMVIGVAAVASIISIGRGARESVEQQLNTLGTDMFRLYVSYRPPMEPGRATQAMIRFDPREMSFTEEDLEKLKPHITDARYVVTTLNTGTEITVGGERRYMNLQGVYPEHFEMLDLTLLQGRFFTPAEYDEAARVVVIQQRTLDEIMPGEPDPVGQTITLFGGVPYTIIGVLAEDTGAAGRFFGRGDGAMVPLTVLKKQFWGWTINEILVKVRPGADVEAVGALSKEFLETIHPGRHIEVFSARQVQQTASGVTDTVARFAAAIAAISLLVGGVGIMNIMLVSVAERTREIGLRKALGATDEAILIQFLTEAVATGVAGGALGLLAAMAPIHVAAKWLQIEIGIDMDTLALALGFAGAIGLLFGVYPAFKAARLDPIEALRQE